jgi:hypothetical protein
MRWERWGFELLWSDPVSKYRHARMLVFAQLSELESNYILDILASLDSHDRNIATHRLSIQLTDHTTLPGVLLFVLPRTRNHRDRL